MVTSEQSRDTTRMFARVIGPYLVVITGTALTRIPDLRNDIADFSANPLWGWVIGSFVLLFGLIVVAFHPYWRGAAAIGVSATGWLTTLKGLYLVAAPGTYLSVSDAVVGSGIWVRILYVAFAVFGLYLTYVGWVPARGR
jgi:hypothetical protein